MDIKWKKPDWSRLSEIEPKEYIQKILNLQGMYIFSSVTFLLFLMFLIKIPRSSVSIFFIYFTGILNVIIWVYIFRHLNMEAEKPVFLKWFRKVDCDLLFLIYIGMILVGSILLWIGRKVSILPFLVVILLASFLFNAYSMIFILHLREPGMRRGVFIKKTYVDLHDKVKEKNRLYQKQYSYEKKMQIETMILSILFISMGVMGILSLGVYGFSKRFICFLIVLGSLISTLWLYFHKKVFLSDVGTLVNEIHEISQGKEMRYSSITEDSALYQAGEDLTNVVDNLNESFQKQVRSEKMKIDLITNVSHDLKTPLTSIIAYIDLLKTTELDDAGKDYVEVLARKSEHLKEMIQDVFEISKATSGTMDIHLALVDVCTLIRQTLVDMEDRIEASDRELRCNLSTVPLYIMSDGGKLYRVFQNLIENALKYSLEGSRIYIDAFTQNDKVRVIIKNVSSYEMDFTEETIVERFSRGDVNRTTEGHGLGLAIVKSFLEACGAEFHIDIDGDLFKAIVTFDMHISEEKDEQAEQEMNDK